MAETADEIRAEIERTRARLTNTIDDLELQIGQSRRKATFVATRWMLYLGVGAGATLLAFLALRAYRNWT